MNAQQLSIFFIWIDVKNLPNNWFNGIKMFFFAEPCAVNSFFVICLFTIPAPLHAFVILIYQLPCDLYFGRYFQASLLQTSQIAFHVL